MSIHRSNPNRLPSRKRPRGAARATADEGLDSMDLEESEDESGTPEDDSQDESESD